MAHAPPKPGEFHILPTLTHPPPALTSSPESRIRLNHAMLPVSSPARSLQFYTSLFGMSRTFTWNVGPFTVYYLAHAAPNDQVPADILATSRVRSGLLELVHVHGCESREGRNGTGLDAGLVNQGSKTVLRGHLGFTVPDVMELLKNAERSGWKVIKWPNDVSQMPGVGEFAGMGEVLDEVFLKTYGMIGFLEDPDG